MEARPLFLACEDDESIVEFLRILTEPLGFDFLAAYDGASAIAELATCRPAVTTLDLVLPKIDGFGVLEKIRALPELDEMPVIVVSALSDSATVRRAYGLGAIDFLTKPFSPDLFEAKLQMLLRMRRTTDELRTHAERERSFRDEVTRASQSFAHEVRNPLAAIGAAAQLISRDDCDPATRSRLARAIEVEAARIDGLLVEYVDRRERPAHAVALDLPALVEEVVEMHLIGSPARQRVSLNCEASMPKVIGDGARLKQAVLNLLFNAVQATEEKGVVELSARTAPGGVALLVMDSGRGIPEKDLSHIFKEGFSSRNSGGLGLYIARRIVEAHHGRLEVESEYGRGTTFTLWLPTA